MKLKDINKKWIEKTVNLDLLKEALDILNVNVGKQDLINLINTKISILKEKYNSEFDNLIDEFKISQIREVIINQGDEVDNRIETDVKKHFKTESGNHKNEISKVMKPKTDMIDILNKSKNVEEVLGELKGFNFSNFGKERNELLRLLISLQNKNSTPKEKIETIKVTVKTIVLNFHNAINADCYPQRDIERIFGMVGDTKFNDFTNFPVDRSVIGAWTQILQNKILTDSNLEDALLKGNLPKIFEQSLKKFMDTKDDYSNKYCSIVSKNLSMIKWDNDIHQIINEIYSLPNINVKQFRETINQGNFQIAYGFDKLHGFFLSVFDRCIEYDKNNSTEVSILFESIDMVGDGGGCYLSLHTGETGFGKKINIKDMKNIWRKYGVENEYLDILN